MSKKNSLTPTVLHLKELPDEGRQLDFSKESGELNETLQDLIGPNNYRIGIEVRPLGNAFEASGLIETELDLNCPRCGSPFKYKVRERIREILVIEEEMPRTGQQARVNHVNELSVDAPSCTSLSSDFFNIGDFVHEIIGLAEPTDPLGDKPCGPDCQNLLEMYNKGLLGSSTKPKEEPSPFAALKNFKVRN